LEPLDNFVEKDHVPLEIFFGSVLEQTDRFRGKLVALPMDIDGGLLFYRKDLVTQAPKTWDELLISARRLQNDQRRLRPEFYGYVWQGAQYEGLVCNFLEVAASAGGGISISRQGVIVDSEANRKALTFMRDLIHVWKVSPPETFSEMREEECRLYFQN